MTFTEERDKAAEEYTGHDINRDRASFRLGADWALRSDVVVELRAALKAAKQMSECVRAVMSDHECATQNTSECDFPIMRDGTMASYDGQINAAITAYEKAISNAT